MVSQRIKIDGFISIRWYPGAFFYWNMQSLVALQKRRTTTKDKERQRTNGKSTDIKNTEWQGAWDAKSLQSARQFNENNQISFINIAFMRVSSGSITAVAHAIKYLVSQFHWNRSIFIAWIWRPMRRMYPSLPLLSVTSLITRGRGEKWANRSWTEKEPTNQNICYHSHDFRTLYLSECVCVSVYDENLSTFITCMSVCVHASTVHIVPMK